MCDDVLKICTSSEILKQYRFTNEVFEFMGRRIYWVAFKYSNDGRRIWSVFINLHSLNVSLQRSISLWKWIQFRKNSAHEKFPHPLWHMFTIHWKIFVNFTFMPEDCSSIQKEKENRRRNFPERASGACKSSTHFPENGRPGGAFVPQQVVFCGSLKENCLWP
jgi:hypothetical protein